jgi:hypothetical protein
MQSYPDPVRSDVRAMMRDYVMFTIHRDWPAHREGAFLDGGRNRVDAMRQRLAQFEPTGAGQTILHESVIGAFQVFSDARQARLSGVVARLPAVLWYAVLVGAAINVLLLVLIRIPIRQQVLLGSIASFFLGVILFVIVALEAPLRGQAALGPEPLQLLWDRQMIWDEA